MISIWELSKIENNYKDIKYAKKRKKTKCFTHNREDSDIDVQCLVENSE